MVIVQIRSGLGNQMFQYAVGRQLAIRNNSQLRLDTSFYADYQLRRFELDSFAIEATKLNRAERILLRGALGHRFPTLGRIAGSVLGGPVAEREDQQNGFDESITKVNGNIYLRGFWQSWKYFSDIRPQLQREFTVRSAIPERDKEMEAQISDSQSICIHIRRGDYVSNPETAKIFGTCTIDYYRSAVELIRARIENPRFFVFSDDPDWCESNFASYAHCTFSRPSPDRLPALDLRLMTMCRHFILSNSTFGWWAAWLAAAPAKTVVAPQNWYRAGWTTKDLFPREWILLQNELI